MSTLPPPFDRSDDADERYRRASGLDPSRPSDSTRRAVLEHAARVAAERTRRAARRRWLMAVLAPKWRPAIVGTLAVAILAAVVIAPQFLAPAVPPERQSPAAAAPANQATAPAAAPAASPGARKPAPRPAPPPAALSAPPAERVVVTEQRAPSRSSANDATLAEPVNAPAAREAMTALQAEQQGSASGARPMPSVAAVARAAPVPGPAATDPDALRKAAAAGDLAVLRAQLAGGGDIDARDAQGRTALMLATLGGQADAVAVLLAHGADPSAADAQGTTPLQAAIAADERGIIAMLRRYGAR
jgi:hypothetical protein